MKKLLKNSKTVIYAIGLIAISIFFNHCKDEDNTKPDDAPLEKAKKDFITANKPEVKKLTLSLSATGGIDSLDLGKGYKLYAQPGTFLINGNPATGNLDVSATIVDTKSDMVLGGVSCFGDSGKAIQSSGMLKLVVSQGGTKATIDPAKPLSIKVPMKGSTQTDFKTFRGGSSTSDSSSWVVDDKSRAIPQNQSYLINSTTLNWINCDRFYNSPNNVKFDVKLPTGYTNTNSNVYVVFKNDHSICRLFGNQTSQSFDFGSYKGIPSGTLVKVVVIASQGAQLQYADQDYTAATGTVTFTAMTNTTDAALKTFLNSL